MSKNTLYITFDGLSDPLGQSQILPYIIFLSQNGYQVTVLSCEKPAALNNERLNIEEQIKHLPISWKYIKYNEQGGAFSRFGYLKELNKMAFDLANEKVIALTHCRSYLSALIGLKLKQKLNIPFLFDMRGFWADERIEGGIWKKSNPLHFLFYKYFKSKEKQFLAQANHVVSLTNAGLKHLNQTFPQFSLTKKAHIIPCCTNTHRFDRTNVKKANSPQGINENDLLLIYTGSIGTWYYTKEMIDCVLAWKEFIPNIKLLVLTKDKHELNLILANYTKQQQSIIFCESVSFTDVPSYLALATAAIYFIKPAFSKLASSPTKMAECWAMNLPIITNSGIGDNDIYFKEHQGGLLISQFSNDEYKRAATNFLQLIKQNNNYRALALQFFDYKYAANQYLSIYNALTS